jgi:predicted lipoprotein with Yx(FWY)xxD motif
VRRSYLAVSALALIAALVIAGCGSSSSSSETTSTGSTAASELSAAKEEAAVTTSAASSSAEATPISLGSAAGVGKILVDSEGMTLYYFQKDQKGSGKSKCEGACAEAWTPLTTKGEPEAMSGVKSAMLGTITRSDGTTQVTYAGWPLYTFVEDKKPGEDNGTDSKAFGASWYPLHSNGKKGGH